MSPSTKDMAKICKFIQIVHIEPQANFYLVIDEYATFLKNIATANQVY